MNNFKFGVFEIFGGLIPGIPILISLHALIQRIPLSVAHLSKVVKDLPLISVVLLAIVCYSIGFVAQYPAYELFKRLVVCWGDKRTKGLPVSIGKRGAEITIIRHESPTNYNYLTSILALRTMSYTLFLTSLVAAGIDLYLMCKSSSVTRDENVIFTSTLIFSVLVLRRAVSFHEMTQMVISDASTLMDQTKKGSKQNN